MRKEEKVRLHIEQTHKNGTLTSQWKEYKIKVDYNAWIKATRANMLERNQSILAIEREGDISRRRDPEPPQTPRSKPLY